MGANFHCERGSLSGGPTEHRAKNDRLETIKRLEFRWEGAYLAACERFGLAGSPAPLFVDEWSAGNVERWLQQEEPDVVIGPVLGKLECLIRASGRKVPKDLGLVGLLVPRKGDRLSGVLQNGAVIGAVAVDQWAIREGQPADRCRQWQSAARTDDGDPMTRISAIQRYGTATECRNRRASSSFR